MTVFAGLPFSGCDKQEKPSSSNSPIDSAKAGNPLPVGLFATVEPANAKSVEEVKSHAKVGDAVVLRGRIGGSVSPFVEGRALFTLVGNGLKACSDNPEDTCATPWDYCCETADEIAKHSATIQIVDLAGAPLKADLRGQHGIKELSEVVVVGKVVQAGERATIISATSIFAAKP
ncbi:MAG TPA: hypothetical protein VNT79_01065 [Phycisphaerae bacterium]|nr:hypothetical protein [Phycisphaerae bacterium]